MIEGAVSVWGGKKTCALVLSSVGYKRGGESSVNPMLVSKYSSIWRVSVNISPLHVNNYF